MNGQKNAILSLWLSSVVCLIAAITGDVAGQERGTVNVPLVNLKAAPAFGVEVSAKSRESATPDRAATFLRFNNPSSERRIVALEGVPDGDLRVARVLAFRFLVEMDRRGDTDGWMGPTPPIVALFFENDGGAWYFTRDIGYSDSDTVRMPLRGPFKRAAFATDEDDSLRLDQVERVWLGLLVDGPGSGTFAVSQPRFTNEPFQPDSPTYPSRSKPWDVAQDPAVKSEFKHGLASTEYHFELPGGRHMYAMFRSPIEVDELDAYSGLQFTYQADLPDGIDGLLVMLIERDGTQYRAVPAPAESSDWKTVTIPFEKFERGSWSKDENDKLDLDQVGLVAIGMHGTTPATAEGTIKVREVRIVP